MRRELATETGSVGVEVGWQRAAAAECNYDVDAEASLHGPFHQKRAALNQRLGRHFDIGCEVQAVEHEFRGAGPQLSVE